jgi:hypothetical protein
LQLRGGVAAVSEFKDKVGVLVLLALESHDFGERERPECQRIVHDCVLCGDGKSLLNWVGGVPYIEQGMSTVALAPPNFKEEEQAGAYESQSNTAVVNVWYLLKGSVQIASPVLHDAVGIPDANGNMCRDKRRWGVWKNVTPTPQGSVFIGPRMQYDEQQLTTQIKGEMANG